MSTDLDILLGNIDHAVRNQTKAEIGGGTFDHVELRMAANEVRRLRGREERLEHDQKLLLAAVVRVLNSRYTVLSPDDRLALNGAYRHVTGT